MADTVDKEKRRIIMKSVGTKHTKPEMIVRRFLFSEGFRFRLHEKKLPGTPDIVLPKYKTVIFVNGCFWHGHDNCKKASMPKSNVDFWRNKIEKNRFNDFKNLQELPKLGWNVYTVWDCELSPTKRPTAFANLMKSLKQKS